LDSQSIIVQGHKHEHGEHGHPMHQHQFDTMEQQYEASNFGMWVFLVQEVMFFGGMFLAYLVYRQKYFAAFGAASNTGSLLLGTTNTAVLIGSSLTVALAVNAAQVGNKKRLISMLVATMLLGFIFLGIKADEYHDKFKEHHVPGPSFCFEPSGSPCPGETNAPSKIAGQLPTHEPVAGTTQFEEREGTPNRVENTSMLEADSARARSMPGAEIYFSLYFAMTGMHALHMIVGEGLLIWLLVIALKDRINGTYFTPVENFGLYWHFVDIIWIFLFPLFYLINRHVGH
jgi:cytochrome c oxidase subunit 3